MTHHANDRREFLRDLGLGTASLPFLLNLPGLASAAGPARRKQRLVVVFSPNGTVRKNFWPGKTGPNFDFKEILKPLEPFRDRALILNGLCDKVRGDGDNHMRGIGCLLTGGELFPGNVQGGSHTPAGWAKGISIDQEIANHLEKDPATRTRFKSLEFGVMVPDRSDVWTRLSYAGGNKPLTPIDDPYQMFNKLYGKVKDGESLRSVLDDVREDLDKVAAAVGAEDRRLLKEHADFVRDYERELRAAEAERSHAVPELEPGVELKNDQMPRVSRMQIELMVNSFAADFTRVATMQYTRSVGGARMRWLGIDDSHHSLSHKPNSDADAQRKLTAINKWYCGEVAHLVKRLAETPEPDGSGSLLDNTTVVWTNELGEGNSHTLNNIPFVLIGGGLGFKTGRAVQYRREPHNRLLLSLAHAFGHHIKEFGNADFCAKGPLGDLA